MPELIDRLLLIDKLDQWQKIALDAKDFTSLYALVCFKVILQEAPTIEAEPVRHGRWIKSDALDYKDPNGVIHVHGMCSCCKLIYDFRDMTSRFKFCPDCGAQMGGGADNG